MYRIDFLLISSYPYDDTPEPLEQITLTAPNSLQSSVSNTDTENDDIEILVDKLI